MGREMTTPQEFYDLVTANGRRDLIASVLLDADMSEHEITSTGLVVQWRDVALAFVTSGIEGSAPELAVDVIAYRLAAPEGEDDLTIQSLRYPVSEMP